MRTRSLSQSLPIQHGQVWRRAALLALLCSMLAMLATSESMHAALLNLLAAIETLISQHPLLGPTVFVLAGMLSAMFAFVSAAAIVPVAVYTWGTWPSIALLWLGWILGGLCAYGLSRFLGRRVVHWLAPNSDALQRLETKMQRSTPLGLIILFQLAMPSEIPGYVLGIIKYSLPRYLVSLALAELPYALATVLLGESFVHGQGAIVLMVGLILITLSVGTFYALRKKLHETA